MASTEKMRGFTLTETLVTVSVIVLMSSFLILTSRSGQDQIQIFKEKAKFIAAVSRARSLALHTVRGERQECGYGVHVIDETQYVLWYDTASVPECGDRNTTYDGPWENVESIIALPKGLRFRNVNDPDALKTILFIPPDPEVVLSPKTTKTGSWKITIGNNSGSETRIAVNRYGQIESSEGY